MPSDNMLPELGAAVEKARRIYGPRKRARTKPSAGNRRADAPAPGTPSNDDAEIARLARLSNIEYERARHAAAEQLGLRASILDRLVAGERKAGDTKQGRALSLPEPEPWPEPVDGAALLSDLATAILRHVVMPTHPADATALWVVHTYLLDVFHISPRLAVTSPERGCGKTTLLDVLSCLVTRSLPAANATAAPIFRVVELVRPTLLIDEGDTFLGEREELRGILDSGHRRGGTVLRTVGDDHEPRQFATYGACAIALIGRLPGTLADRSIPIALQRRRADEQVEPFRADRASHLDMLARQTARWAANHAEQIRLADPAMPAGLFNRAADNWRPLLAVADTAGGEWPRRAREACAALAGAIDDDQSAGVLALGDIREIFAARGVGRLASAELVEAMLAIEGRPWAEWRGGRPLTTNGLARLLRAFSIGPENIRTAGGILKGYLRERFVELWARYSCADPPEQPLQRYNADGCGISSRSATATYPSNVAVSKSQKPAPEADCSVVAVATHPTGGNGAKAVSKLDTIETPPILMPNSLCAQCGRHGARGDPLSPWRWGSQWFFLHPQCEKPFADSRKAAGDEGFG